MHDPEENVSGATMDRPIFNAIMRRIRATGELLPCGLAAAAGEPPEVVAGRLAVPPGPGLLGDAILGR